ncbi:MAG TPA: adenylosuccinate lyase [Candidatus Paceibacterota bacterium]|nr:adenylosuccinate lyase [Candidatus Paceibacterota bacterium]
MPLEPLTAVSSIDGRYREITGPVAEYFSEFAFIKYRILVECEYLLALSKTPKTGVRRLTDKEQKLLKKLSKLSLEDARSIKEIEKDTNHDVKAIEYFIKQKLQGTSLEDVSESVHFAITSEDVNSVAYGLMLRDFFEKGFLGGPMWDIAKELEGLAKTHAKTPMLARTHGQSASPTTFGKEMRVFLKRLQNQVDVFKHGKVLVKWGGATGNYNAHVVAAPDVNWPAFSKKFIESFNLEGKGKKHYMCIELNEFTTQIELHDTYAEYFDYMRRINTILIDLSQDLWRYISDGWLTQKAKKGETGSSTMPHKVNPIDFENAEGNLGVANALFEHFSRKLPISRLQRDLSDSTVERVFGTAFAHSLIAYRSLVKGFGKISVNKGAMLQALRAHPEVLAEAIQTVLRRQGVALPYEKLKELSRGRQVTLKDFAEFIDGLDIDAKLKKRLKALRPENYLGLAERIARG